MTTPTWRPEEHVWRKVLVAVSSPAMIGGVVFACAVVIAAVVVFLRPHETPTEAEPLRVMGDAAVAPGVHDVEAPASVVVYVSGHVANPGVFELDSGSRVHAAIDAAGGPSESGVLDGINLARLVIDGEHIMVPDGTTSAEAGPHGNPGVTSDGRVNLNHADTATLEQLPKIGPALASRIIDWREANGGFASVDDLLQVSGIGNSVLEHVRDLVIAP